MLKLLFSARGLIFQPCDCYLILRKGEAFVDKFMAETCALIQVDETFQGAVAGFLKFREQYRGRPGKE